MAAMWGWWIGFGEIALAVGLRLAGQDDAAGAALSMALWVLAWAGGRAR